MWHINTAMQKLITEKSDSPVEIRDVITKRFEKYLGDGLIVMDGILSTPWFWMHRGSLSLANCHDETGLECAINRLYIDGEFEKTEWLDAIFTFGNVLSALRTGHALRLIAGADDLSCTVRFHLIRDGQDWLDLDIERYSDPVMYTDFVA